MRFHIGLSALLLVFGALEIHLTPAPADSIRLAGLTRPHQELPIRARTAGILGGPTR